MSKNLKLPPNTFVGIGGPEYVRVTARIEEIDISNQYKMKARDIKQYLTNNFT